jgi:hypothetical protein
MKVLVNSARVIVGLLFIFSGLVKAIDPRGLSYKMEEFFEAWAAEDKANVADKNTVSQTDSVAVYQKGGEAKRFEVGTQPDSSWTFVQKEAKPVSHGLWRRVMNGLHQYALVFSIFMIALEVLAGLALLLGWRARFFSGLLFLLIVFFTFLTAYVLFTGKIKACGCFGDCIPLTPVQTFTKDIILLVLAIVIMIGHKSIRPLFAGRWNLFILVIATAGITGMQWYVLQHGALADCLPYKKGNNILKLREMPENAIPDKYAISLVYEKNGEKKVITDMKNLPDSTWTFVERKQELVEKGSNNIPLINDFTLTSANGNDTTTALLSTPGEYFIVFVKDAATSLTTNVMTGFYQQAGNRPVFFVTSERDKVAAQLVGKPFLIFSCDATVLKTVSRTDVMVYKMKGPVVQGKWSSRDADDIR